MLDWSGLSLSCCVLWQPLLSSGVVIANQVVKQLVGQKREKSTDAHKKRGQTFDLRTCDVGIWNCHLASYAGSNVGFYIYMYSCDGNAADVFQLVQKY